MSERREVDLRAEVARQFAGEERLAPVEEFLGMRFVAWGDGESRWEMEVDERHHNPTGVVQGGILGALADVSMATAFIWTLERGEMFTTVELSMNYLRPVTVGTIAAEGRVLHRGRRTAVLEARVLDPRGKEAVRAKSTVILLAADGAVG